MQFVAEPVGTKHRVKLDISDVEIDNKDKLAPYLLFNGDTYKPISQYGKSPSDFDHIFRGANWLLANLQTNEQKVAIVKFFASMNYTIKNKMPTMMHGVPSFAEDLGKHYLALIDEVKMIDMFEHYARNMITLQDTSKFGTRPQDRDELTFKEPEMRELMVVALFCKFVSPIFGELIGNLPEQIGEDGKRKLPPFKESLVSSFLNNLLSTHFADLINKLQGYIRHIVDGMYGKEQDPAAIFTGLTPNTRTSIILSSLLVRNYVLCVLEVADSNIARYTDTMVRTLSQTQDNAAHKSQVKTRVGSKMSMGDEGSEMAQMEIDSLVSNGTMDGPIIISASIDGIIDARRQQHEITLAEFNECLKWYDSHPIYQTALNLLVATAVYGRELGGGRGIEMLRAKEYTKLIAMLQLMAINMGFYHLATILTASKATTVKLKVSIEEENFKRQAPVLTNYRNCRARFSDSRVTSNEIEWDKQVGDILTDLIQNIYLVNTPDWLLDHELPNQTIDGPKTMADIVGRNGDRVQITTAISEEMCSIILVNSAEIF